MRNPVDPTVPTRPPATAVTVLAALTERERGLFFGRSDFARIAPSAQWISTERMPPAEWRRRLEATRPACLVSGWSTPPLPKEWLAEPDCPLRYVCHVTGSVRQLVPREFIARGGLVTNWGNTVGAQVAEHALLLALAALRNLSAWRPFMAARAGRQIEEIGTRTLFGRRVGLHGFGSVAQALVPLLAPFGVAITAYSAGVPVSLMQELGVVPAGSLRELFAASEVLFECESLTPATAASVDAGVLAALPAGAVFVNVGRGGLVDDEALLREAAGGRIRLALDVANGEPITPASRYWALPDAVLSPHIGGPTTDHYAACGTRAGENIARFLRGEMPVGALDLATYDRST